MDRGSDEVFQKSNLEDDEFHNFLSFPYGMLDVVRGVAQKCCSKVLQKKKRKTLRIPEFLCYLAKILIFSLT